MERNRNLFIGSASTGYQNEMKASESTNGNNENGDEDDEKESDHNGHIGNAVILLQEHERQRHAEYD